MDSTACADETTDPDAEESLVVRLHRTACDLERVRAKYEVACNERDAAQHERDAAVRRSHDLERQNAQLQAFAAQLQDDVTRLTDELAVLRPDAPIKVTGPTRNAS